MGSIVEFRTADGLLLNGFLAKARGKRKCGVLFLHGLGGNFYRSRMIKRMALELPKAGMDFLSIEQRGSYGGMMVARKKGKRSSSILAGGWFERFRDSAYDIEGGIRRLRKEGAGKVFVIGHSTGCQKAAYYQSLGKKGMDGVVLVAPADDYNSARKEGARFESSYGYARKTYRKSPLSLLPYGKGMMIESVSRFMSRVGENQVEGRIFNYERKDMSEFRRIRIPVLALFGSDDQYLTMPAERHLEILRDNYRGRSFASEVMAGADHSFHGKEMELAKEIIRWIKNCE